MYMMLKVVPITGQNCITVEDGEQIYKKIHSEIIKGHDVTLDFTGVEIFASPFFNTAIGQLFRDLNSTQINSNLHFIGLSSHGNHILKRVMENAQKYYKNSRFRDSVERVLAQQALDL